MKKFLLAVVLLMLPNVAFAQGYGLLNANSANQIKVNTSGFGNNIAVSSTTVQSALNWLNQASFSGGGTPASPTGTIQFNNGGSFGSVTGSGVVGGNVGISSVNPTVALDVVGTIKASSDVLVAGSSVCRSNGVNCPAGGTNPWLLTTGSGNVGISTTNNVGIGTFMGIGAGLVVMNGNVGIGTWNPTALLSVGGGANNLTVDSSGNLTQLGGVAVTVNSTQYSTNTNGIALFQNTNNGASALTKVKGGANAASSLQLMPTSGAGVGSEFISLAVGNNGGSEVMRITGAGNVGIGTTVAPNKEYVAGTLETQGFKLPGNGVAAGSVLMSNSVGVGTWMPASAVAINSVGANPSASVGLSAVNGSATTFMRSDAAPQLDQAIVPTWTGLHAFNKSPISLTTTNNVGIGTATPPNILYVAGTSEMQGFQLRGNGVAAGNILQTNSVGIGTWMKVVDVVGSIGGASFYQTVQDEGSDLTQRAKVNFVGNGVTCADNGGTSVTDCTINGGAGSSQWVTSTNVGIGTYDNVGVGTVFPLAKLVVLSGNVGIGTFTAAQSLDVKGNEIISGNLGIAGAAATSPLNVTGNGLISGNLGVGGAGATKALNITGDGAISSTLALGASAAVANSTLEVKGTGALTYMLNSTSTAAFHTCVSEGGATPADTFYIGQGNNCGSSFALAVDPNRNVGMGVGTPKSLFAVNAGVAIGSPYAGTNSAPTNGLIVVGNVGIGTTIPPNAEYVAGTLETQGFQLRGNGVGSSKVLTSTSVGIGTWMTVTDLFSSAGGGSPGGTGSELQFRGGASTFSAVTGSSVDGNGNIGLGTTVPGGSLIVMTGNVGIGTWVPAQILDIKGKLKTSGGIIKRVVTVSDATSLTPNSDTSDMVSQTNTQAAGTLTFNAPTGSPSDGQALVIRVISTNSQTNSWNAAYTGNLPGSTAAGTNYYAFIYYSTGTVWHYTGGAGI